MSAAIHYEGLFNINQEQIKESTHARSEVQAKRFMAKKIADKKKVMPYVVLGYLKTHQNSYEIKAKG